METGDDVILYMQKFSQEDPNKIIEGALSDIETISSDIEMMIARWKAGDLEALDKNFSEKMRKDTPAAYQSLIVERNQNGCLKLQTC